MRQLLLLCLVLITVSCGPGKEELLGETEWQRKTNAMFKDASKSPLKKKDLKRFKSLDFYKYDSIYRVEARLKRTPDSKWFKMKTTTNEETDERVYGILSFELKGKTHQLNVYQSKSSTAFGKMDKSLFLPFLDDTNGETSYSGGRYINLTIPENDTIIVDFNESYNPYCAYNENYSCPIVPRVNYVPVKVEAGLKAFRK